MGILASTVVSCMNLRVYSRSVLQHSRVKYTGKSCGTEFATFVPAQRLVTNHGCHDRESLRRLDEQNAPHPSGYLAHQ